MSDMSTKKLKRYWVFGLVILGFIPTVIADDGLKDCSPDNSFGLSVTYQCLDRIYNQNIQIIQEQNQTNHLIAMQTCEKNYFGVQYPDDNTVNGKEFTDCVNHLLGVSQ